MLPLAKSAGTSRRPRQGQPTSERSIHTTPTLTSRLSAREVVRLLRAEIESAKGQPELYFTISKEYLRKGDRAHHSDAPNHEPAFDFVIEHALLTIEPRRERDYWVLKVEVKTPVGRRSHYDDAGLLHKDLTLDEFEQELSVFGKRRIAVRLEAETLAARDHFKQWKLEMRTRHPVRAPKTRVAQRIFPSRKSERSELEPLPKSDAAHTPSRECETNGPQGGQELREIEKGMAMLVESMLPLAQKKLLTLPKNASLVEAGKLLAHKEANLVVICHRNGKLAGVIAKTDIVRELCGRRSLSRRNTANAMTRKVLSCHPKDYLADLWSNMKANGFKHIPIVDADSRPIGLAIARDVLELMIEEFEHEEQLLRDYVMCVGSR
jgi:CBS domain-containing protein